MLVIACYRWSVGLNSLEQDADYIILLWRGEYYHIPQYEDGTPTADTVLFDIAKHRNGATDEVIAACSMRRGFFSNLEPILSITLE